MREAENSLQGIGVGSMMALAEITRLSPVEGQGNLKTPMSLGGWDLEESPCSLVRLAERCYFPPSALCSVLFFQQPKLHLLLGT